MLTGLLFVSLTSGAHAKLVVDGRLDEPEWAQSMHYDDFRVVVPYRLTTPGTGAGTQVRLVSTPDGIAVGFVLEQSPAVARVKPRLERDRTTPADRVTLIIDFDGDGRTAYSFGVDLSGSVQDGVVGNENQLELDWDTEWSWAVSENDAGWQAELLIPWTVAPMRGADTRDRTIGVYFSRTFGSTGEQVAFPAVSVERAQFVSGFERVQIPQYRKSLLRIWPYVTAYRDRVGGRTHYAAGADLFWKPSPTFQLSATFNPDFGQVESDDLVIDFDATETFNSDRRPFFTENQSIFALTTPDAGRLVHTRRIGGDADDGTGASEIDTAFKLNGYFGSTGYGLLVASEQGPAGRDFQAVRLQYPIRPGLNLGWLGTVTRRPFFDRVARVNVVDLGWRYKDKLALDAQVLASVVEQESDDREGFGAWARAFWMPSQRWSYEVEATHFSKYLDFNDLGYQRRASLNELEITGMYLHRIENLASRLSSSQWSAEAQLRSNADGDRLPTWLILRNRNDFRSGSQFYVDWSIRSTGWDDRISRGNGLVQFSSRQDGEIGFASPRLGDWSFELALSMLSLGLEASPSRSMRLALNWFPSDIFSVALELAPDHSRDWLIWEADRSFGRYERRGDFASLGMNWFPGRRHEFRLKSEWAGVRATDGIRYRLHDNGRLLGTGEVLPAFDVNHFGLQLRYRYLLGPQSDVFLAWSRGGFLRQDRSDIGTRDLFADALALRDADQILAKIRYRF